jgi:hypothetical protein
MRRRERLLPLFLGRETNHPLGLKWQLHELESEKESKGTTEFLEAAQSNLRRVRAIVARDTTPTDSGQGFR